MPGSRPTELPPDGGSGRSRPFGRATLGAPTAERTPASEPRIEPPLLRDFDRGLAAAGVDSFMDEECRRLDVDAIVAQLAPILTRESLLASLEREANPADEQVRAAYAQAWMRLTLSGARRRTRRAGIAASMPTARSR